MSWSGSGVLDDILSVTTLVNTDEPNSQNLAKHAGAKPPLKSVIRASKKNSNMAAKLRANASGLNLFDIPSKMSGEKSRRVKTGYLEQKNGGQIRFPEKTSFVLICKLPGLFLKRHCLKHAWSGERRQFTC